MVQAENGAWGASSYLYDPLGERKQKVVGVNTAMPVATDFVLAGGEEIADYYESSATWRLTVRGAGGLPLVTVVPAAGGSSEEIVYVHHDMKGSTVALTVPGGFGPAESYTYSDYGQPQSGSWLAYQYAGYRYDGETGLYYMPARSYSPALGRFLQADPSGFGGGFNLYAYAGNDPVNLTDSTGQSPDGGGYTVTLSESVAGFFGPSLIVAATAKVNTYSIYASNGNLQLINPSGYTIGNYRYSTGLNGDTNPADRNKGPLPPGTYTLDPSEISAAGFARKYLDYRDWGDYRVPLHPVDGTNTYGRSGFFLHGGWKRLGSEGCLKVIDLNQDELFQTLMQVPGPVIVTDR
jgi:RHS repeat-associated protein